MRIEVRGQILAGANFSVDVQRPIVKTFDEVLSGQKLRAKIKSDIPIQDVAMGKRTGIDYHCIGWIAYWDQNGLRLETGFCFRADLWDKLGERWVSAGKPEYEYVKSRIIAFREFRPRPTRSESLGVACTPFGGRRRPEPVIQDSVGAALGSGFARKRVPE
jgi:hypothetical protein